MTRTDRKINVFVNHGTLFLDVQFYLSAHVECTAELFELSLQLSCYVRILDLAFLLRDEIDNDCTPVYNFCDDVGRSRAIVLYNIGLVNVSFYFTVVHIE
jgi:hypothetical protein